MTIVRPGRTRAKTKIAVGPVFVSNRNLCYRKRDACSVRFAKKKKKIFVKSNTSVTRQRILLPLYSGVSTVVPCPSAFRSIQTHTERERSGRRTNKTPHNRRLDTVGWRISLVGFKGCRFLCLSVITYFRIGYSIRSEWDAHASRVECIFGNYYY